MTDLADVKQKFVDILKADAPLVSLLGSDAAGQTPIYKEWPMGKMMWLPEVTVIDIVDHGEVSGLNDAFDGSKRYEWDSVLIQVDVWAKTAQSRDSISSRIKKVLLKAVTDFRAIGVALSAPEMLTLNEVKRLIFRHSLRYRAFFVTEAPT